MPRKNHLPSYRLHKQPWRYPWPDDFRDEVLARLLELNKQRAEQEALAGSAEKPTRSPGKKAAPPPSGASELF